MRKRVGCINWILAGLFGVPFVLRTTNLIELLINGPDASDTPLTVSPMGTFEGVLVLLGAIVWGVVLFGPRIAHWRNPASVPPEIDRKWLLTALFYGMVLASLEHLLPLAMIVDVYLAAFIKFWWGVVGLMVSWSLLTEWDGRRKVKPKNQPEDAPPENMPVP